LGLSGVTGLNIWTVIVSVIGAIIVLRFTTRGSRELEQGPNGSSTAPISAYGRLTGFTARSWPLSKARKGSMAVDPHGEVSEESQRNHFSFRHAVDAPEGQNTLFRLQ
jgi:hypothetical protein